MINHKRPRPNFPKKAIVTAGMPYGNKLLHFGHVGGVFIHADIFTRFLRDRIGNENVIFVSGTDCYGSPISASYKKLVEEGYDKTIEEYVESNYIAQKKVLDDYEISLNLYGASALGRAGEIHKQLSADVFNKLYKGGFLRKMDSPQFYDADFDQLLNGRQVVGKCPFEGCKSEKAYADECSLGHQYMPSELIDPVSTLSGKKPELKAVTNWYFKLEDYREMLQKRIDDLKVNSNERKYLLKTIEEFLKAPIIYVKRKELEEHNEIHELLPKHEIIDEPKKPSISFVFDNLEDRDAARAVFDKNTIRYRTGKTLVPFRISGNVEWGIPVPTEENLDDLTFWVWPESLWAPISFTKAYLESEGKDSEEWRNWWNKEDNKVYQFIGEDNIYFYGIAEMGLFDALWGDENLPHLIPNNHVLYMDVKASSSGEIKPPMAHELLEHYTTDQLRMHFLSLGLAKKSVSFSPQAYMKEEDKQGPDTVLKDGNLLTNVFNRVLRSAFYTSQTYFDSKIPEGEVSEKILSDSQNAIYKYEKFMYNHDFHQVTYVLDSYIRNMNKHWTKHMKDPDDETRKQVLIDTFYAIRVALSLLHPIVPSSTEYVRTYLNINESIWSWDNIFEGIETFIDIRSEHVLKELQPKHDFFKKHESQLNF